MHGNICDTYQVHNVDELKQCLTKVWHGVGQSFIDDAMLKWHKRLWACVHVKGGHFEHLKHLIWLTSTHLFCCITYIKRIAIVQIFCISQGSVVTHLRCSGKYGTSLVANLLLSPTPTVKKFLKLANISQSYERISSGTLFMAHSVVFICTVHPICKLQILL